MMLLNMTDNKTEVTYNMPDISMCMNKACPIKGKCHRYTATHSPYRQSYGYFKPKEDGGCDYFWDNRVVTDEP